MIHETSAPTSAALMTAVRHLPDRKHRLYTSATNRRPNAVMLASPEKKELCASAGDHVALAVHPQQDEQWADRQRDPQTARRFSVLAATGLIIGESLSGVAFAGIVAATGKDSPLAVVGAGFAAVALSGSLALFVTLIWWMYRRTRASATA